MRLQIRYQIEGEEPAEIRSNLMDLIVAERHFKLPSKTIIDGEAFEHITFILHSQLKHRARGGGDSIKPFEEWLPTVEHCMIAGAETIQDIVGKEDGEGDSKDLTESALSPLPSKPESAQTF